MIDLPVALPELAEMARVSRWLAQLGWSEAGSGNLSLRLEALPEQVAALPEGPALPLPLPVPRLAGRHLLLTGTGARARETPEDLQSAVGLFRVLPGGEALAPLWGNPRPTSELSAHVAVQEALLDARPRHRAVLHSHPANLIALTHLPEFQEGRRLSDVLLRMQSEARLLLPEGLAHLPFHLPGSVELGRASARACSRHLVVLWHMHGALATGETLSDALDHLELVDKAAQVYWTLRAAGVEPQGMRPEDVERSLRHFGRWDRYRAAHDDQEAS